ncbi:hypothetical protein [Gordonia sp. (in: high G+C Gram-positive bacteria)]|uniref:hypothetical protein n=2 Tax=Gordonia sp. (in: high G+C Gram-positive bacteria) TaxID=84139 RepID=UPI0025808D3A|nr:hypothetical protein [Gordonia sp. (in: high G+C Gram-positive bacteria)]
MSDHDSVTESRWSEIYRLLSAPGGEAFALAGTATANKARRERSGTPIELITEAERAGGGKAIWAVVAPIRSDLLVIDLDRCAHQVWPHLRDVLGDYSATAAYLARSGSPDSLHVILKCASAASDRGIREFLADLRRQLNLSARRIDVLSPGHLLRLPGSASLKPGGRHCTPVNDNLTPITAVQTAERLRVALGSDEPGPVQATFTRHDDGWCVQLDAAVYRPGLEVEVHRRDGQIKRVRIGAVVAHAGERVRAAIADDLTTHSPTAGPMVALSAAAQMHELAPAAGGPGELQWQAPRAWRRRTPISAQQWRVLNATGGEDRSAAATAAAWVLWDVGLRSFAAVRWFYAHCPAFAKFRDRDGDRRGARSACAAHWQSIAERASTHRPPLDPADQALVDDALAEVATWDEPELVAAAVAVITHRYTDGHGLVDRPIAKRCLAGWMSVCDSRAFTHLYRLQERGLLVRTRDWRDGPANEAALYSLRVPDALYQGNGAHDVTDPHRLHPLWGQLGHHAHLLWSLLSREASPLPTLDVAQRASMQVGGSGWGAIGVLTTLGSLGLVSRRGTGKGTRWTVTPEQAEKAAVDGAARSSGAFERAQQLLARIVGERKAYHAEGPGERARMRTGLKVLRNRLTHSDVAGRDQGSLFSAVAPTRDGPDIRRSRRMAAEEAWRGRGLSGTGPTWDVSKDFDRSAPLCAIALPKRVPHGLTSVGIAAGTSPRYHHCRPTIAKH